MSDPRHDAFAEAAAAYALGVLDVSEREGFERHLRTCDACQADVRAYRQVSPAIGASVEPAAPSPDLKARVLAAATPGPAARVVQPRDARRSSALWLAAAASLVLNAGIGYYAWSVRTELAAANDLASRATADADRLRGELAEARDAAALASRIADVLSAPDAVRVQLAATRPDFPGQAFGYWSRSAGLWLSGDRLPAPAPGRVYQLWLIAGSQPPMSAGLLPLDASGSVAMVTPPGGTAVAPRTEITLAITEEPAGGSPGPTTPILLAGRARTE